MNCIGVYVNIVSFKSYRENENYRKIKSGGKKI